MTTLDRMLEYAGREYVRHEKPVAAQLCLLARIAAAHDMTTAPMTEHDAKEG